MFAPKIGTKPISFYGTLLSTTFIAQTLAFQTNAFLVCLNDDQGCDE
jgi:hypothetical protein